MFRYTNMDGVFHPYTPPNLQLENFVANSKTGVRLLLTFFGTLSTLLAALYLAAGYNKYMREDFLCRMKMCWFFSCGFIHLVLEGFYFFNYQTLPSNNSFLAQMWKEYSICDSRYIAGDSFIVCMEGITSLLDGPLALYALYTFVTHHHNRYIIQLCLSLCQLYGDVLYFTTEYVEDFNHGPYGDVVYFWFYFVFMNLLWIVIPILCIWESFKVLCTACSSHDLICNTKKGQ